MKKTKDANRNFFSNMQLSNVGDRKPIQESLRNMFGWNAPHRRINEILLLQVCRDSPAGILRPPA